MTTDDMRARYRDHAVIRASGAVSGLADGVQSTINGLTTRLVAWPGTGFQTEAVHVITVEAGQESERYRYDLAEEALLCHSGGGEVWLRDAWVPLEPGDMAYVPEGIERAVRVPATADQPLVLVAQITPPQIDHYAAHGFYNVELGVMNYDSIRKACTDARAGPKPVTGQMAFRDAQPEHRAWNLDRDDVRRRGALLNVYMGAPFAGIGLPMRLVLWPGAGCRTAGFNYAYGADGVEDTIHKHPVSDECLFIWSGGGRFFVGDRWVEAEAGDCVLAPCGVAHGHKSEGPAFFGGFASPPQLDLLIPTDYYDAGTFTSPAQTRLEPGD